MDCSICLDKIEDRMSICQLKKNVRKLKAQIQFIKDYNQKVIIVRMKTKIELKRQLTTLKYPLVHESYDYLTDMPIISLTIERSDRLKAKYLELSQQLQHLLENRKAFITLKCKHKLHLNCFLENMIVGVTKDKCPLCRTSVNIPQKILYSFDNLMESESESESSDSIPELERSEPVRRSDMSALPRVFGRYTDSPRVGRLESVPISAQEARYLQETH